MRKMALTPDEQAALDALTKKAAETDEDDFHIEIWDETGAGAKVPYSKGKTWLQRFGIDLPVEPAPDPAKPAKPAKPADDKTPDTVLRHFGRKPA
jgi:hypothetical protein